MCLTAYPFQWPNGTVLELRGKLLNEGTKEWLSGERPVETEENHGYTILEKR